MKQNYKNGELIFRQGEMGSCMYVIQSGKVGIYLNYGEADQAKLTELSAGQFMEKWASWISCPAPRLQSLSA